MSKDMTINQFKAEYAAIAEALIAEGKASVNAEAIADAARAQGVNDGLAQGKTEGATTERARIQGVLAQSMPGHEKLVNTLAFDGKTTGPEAAVQVLNAERTARATTLGNLQEDGRAPAVVKPSNSVEDAGAGAAADAGLPVDERCKKAWDSNPQVRAEFLDLASYTAFEKAKANGQVKILGSKKSA